jgi:TrmH family RNA methyltransferase
VTRRPCITSSTNDRVKALRRLSRRARRADRVFLVEGHRQLRCALEAGARVVEVYAAPELFLGPGDAELVALAERRGARVVELAGAAFVSAAVGCARTTWPPSSSAVRPGSTRGRRARGRSCSWRRGSSDRATSGRSSAPRARPGRTGSSSATPRRASSIPTRSEPPSGRCSTFPSPRRRPAPRSSGSGRDRLGIVVATPGGARPHWDAAYGASVAIVVGSERHGVSDSWLDAADETVEIPMPGLADSLTVAVAAGIVPFEAARRRVGVHPGAAVR